MALVICVYAYITSKTTIGRHLYAVGGNEKATKLSGINTKRVYFFAYCLLYTSTLTPVWTSIPRDKMESISASSFSRGKR